MPQDLDSFDGDLIVAVVGEDERPLRASNAWLDWRLYGSITDLIVHKRFSGFLGEKCLLPTYGKFQFDRLVLLGGGKVFEDEIHPSSEGGAARWMEIALLIAKTIESLKVEKLGLSLPRFDQVDNERALLKTLQASRLPGQTSLFVSRALPSSAPILQ